MSPVEKPAQADREAAAALMPGGVGYGGLSLQQEKVIAGKCDDDPLVQAFARHRLAADQAARATTTEGVREAAEALLRCHDARGAVEHRKDLWEALAASLATPPATPAAKECPQSPDGRHQVDTSMESGPNNCFHCEAPMGGRHVL